MKILVLSDSHSALSFMRNCIDAVHPDAIIHLGDYFDDGEAMAEEYPHIRMYQVPGNCDRYRCRPDQPEILILTVGGVMLYMTHGHRHNVKLTLGLLLRDARAAGAAAALYGHTHVADCTLEEDGLWVLNPGSCGYYGGSAALMEITDGKIQSCRILRQEDLEEFA
jgi:putative phosphoesterase